MPPANDTFSIEQELRAIFAGSSDVIFGRARLLDGEDAWGVLLIHCEGLTDAKQIDQGIMPQLSRMTAKQVQAGEIGNLSFQALAYDKDAIVEGVFSGMLVLLFDGFQELYAINISNPPQRNTEESNTEVSVKGPRDGFTESLITNVALVRKRLKTADLRYESFVIGRKSRTKVALLYLNDVINPSILDIARKRMSGIDIDALVSSEELIEYIADSPFRLFPLVDYIGRPDFAVAALLMGRFIAIVDGTPMVLIAPATLSSLLKTPEDVHASFVLVMTESFLRYVGLMVSIFLPGFFIALTCFQLDQIPFSALATVINERRGIPLTSPLEGFLMQILFELFREAGIRLPKGVGQTVTVVGGLFIGQAAIEAGLTSPAMLVVTALSMVASYTLVNQSLSGLVTVLRMFVLLCSSFLGMYGFFLGMFAILLYLSTMESFGVPYLAPLSPPVFQDMLRALFTKPRVLTKTRPVTYGSPNRVRKGSRK